LLIEQLGRRLHVRDGGIEFAADCGRTVGLAGRPLAFVPMLVPGRRTIVGFDEPEAAYIAYSVPGLGPTATSTAEADSLALLLGPIRAAMLRSLDQPVTMEVLAHTVQCAPSTLTYHCNQLGAAGLLVRQRTGRYVWVSRSERGDRLVDLLR
jgi:hypothetical protein